MKLKKFFIILCLFVLPITVNAKNDDFINHFGVKISSEQFNKLKSMGYDTRLINALEPEQFEQLINSEVIAEESKCYKISTKYDKFGNIIDKKEIEISESENRSKSQ